MNDTDTIIVIRHYSQCGETFVWLLTDETAETIDDDLRRLWLAGRLGCREVQAIQRRLDEAMVRVC